MVVLADVSPQFVGGAFCGALSIGVLFLIIGGIRKSAAKRAAADAAKKTP
jgi:hypothetical protein